MRKAVMLGSVSEIGTKKQAQVHADRILRGLNLSERRPQSTMSFEQFVRERWIPAAMPLLDSDSLKLSPDALAKIGIEQRPGSAENYASLLRTQLLPAFSGKPLNQIARWDIQSFLTEKLRRGYSAAYVRAMRATLSKVLRTAVEWGFIHDNPALGCGVRSGGRVKKRVHLNPAEVLLLLAALPDPCRSVVSVAVLTGLRIGEILALRWGRLNFQGGTFSIEESYSGRFGPPKTRSSRRVLPMSARVRAVFETQRQRRIALGESDVVFATAKGTPLNPKNLRNRVLEPVRKSLGLPPISWHSFRYTHATMLSEAQVPARVAQSILGHSDAAITLNVYTQVVTESERLAMEKVAALLDPNGPKFHPVGEGRAFAVN
jgi:integrase